MNNLFANKKVLFIGIGAMLAVLIGAGLLISSQRDPLKDNMQRVSLRYGDLVSLTDDAKKQIRNGDLAKVNSEANILFTGDNATIGSELNSRYGSKIDKQITASETDNSTAAKLENEAYLGRYDTAYKEILTQKIERLDAMLVDMISQSKSKSLDGVLQKARTNTSSLYKSLEALKL